MQHMNKLLQIISSVPQRCSSEKFCNAWKFIHTKCVQGQKLQCLRENKLSRWGHRCTKFTVWK